MAVLQFLVVSGDGDGRGLDWPVSLPSIGQVGQEHLNTTRYINRGRLGQDDVSFTRYFPAVYKLIFRVVYPSNNQLNILLGYLDVPLSIQGPLTLC